MPTNFLSIVDHFVELVLKGLTIFLKSSINDSWQRPVNVTNNKNSETQ